MVRAFDFHVGIDFRFIRFAIVPNGFFLPIGLHAVQRHTTQIVGALVIVHRFDIQGFAQVCRKIDVVLHHIQKAHTVRNVRELEVPILIIRESCDFRIPILTFEHKAQIGRAVVRAATQFIADVARAAKHEFGRAQNARCRGIVMPVMIVTVTGIGNIFVPPNGFGIDAVVYERFPFYNRPARQRTRFKTAVDNFILVFRSSGIFIGTNFYKVSARFLRVFPADANIVHAEIPVIMARIVIYDTEIQFFADIFGQIYRIIVEIFRVVHARRILTRVYVRFRMFQEIIVFLYRDQLIVIRTVNPEIATLFRRFFRCVFTLADRRRAACKLYANRAVAAKYKLRRAHRTCTRAGIFPVERLTAKIPVTRLIDGQSILLFVVIISKRFYRRHAVVVECVAVFDRPTAKIRAFKTAVDNRCGAANGSAFFLFAAADRRTQRDSR